MVQSVDVYRLDIPSIWTITKSNTNPKKPPMRHNRDTNGSDHNFYKGMNIKPVVVMYIRILDSQT